MIIARSSQDSVHCDLLTNELFASISNLIKLNLCLEFLTFQYSLLFGSDVNKQGACSIIFVSGLSTIRFKSPDDA